jgi:hypothetical protein
VERIAPNGDSHIDLELFQTKVSPNLGSPDNDFWSVGSPLPNTLNGRTPGDIIISMDFNIGGTLGSVTVREWIGPNGPPTGVTGSPNSYSDPIITVLPIR